MRIRSSSFLRDLYRRGRASLTKARARFLLGPIGLRVRADGLTYLSQAKLLSLKKCTESLRRNRVKGDFIECGVALGGSSILLCSSLDGNRRFHGYDVFGMIPAPSERDGDDVHLRYAKIVAGESTGIGSDPYYGYVDNLFERVRTSMVSYGFPVDGKRISLYSGLFENTLYFDEEMVIALAHIDCDWHDPVALCLERLGNHIAAGGVIIADDYNDYSGCRKAVDDFIERRKDFELTTTEPHAIMRRLPSFLV